MENPLLKLIENKIHASEKRKGVNQSEKDFMHPRGAQGCKKSFIEVNQIVITN